MWTEIALITGLSLGLGCILVMMGTKTSLNELKETCIKKRTKIAYIWINHYIICPSYAILLVKIFKMNTPRALGLLLASVTPPTAAASITTFIVGGDIELSVSSSVICLLSSFIFMPLVFAGQVYIINTDDIKLRLPYGQMSGILIFLVISKGIGLYIKHKYVNSVDRVCYIMKRAAIFCMIFSLVMFILSRKLVTASFYSGSQWPQHYLSSIAFIVGSGFLTTIFSRIFKINNIKECDAILITTLRKNPGIAVAVAALSFNSLSSKDFSTAFGYVFINAMLLDWCSFPFIAILRKLRLGYICCAEKKAPTDIEDIMDKSTIGNFQLEIK